MPAENWIWLDVVLSFVFPESTQIIVCFVAARPHAFSIVSSAPVNMGIWWVT